MFRVEVNGKATRLEEAVTESAAMLTAARLPVFAGLGVDVAATRNAVLLAERLGGVIDHLASEEVLSNLCVMQRSGWMTVSPGEVERSCDLLVRVGLDTGEIKLTQSAEVVDVSPNELPLLRALLAGRSLQRLSVGHSRLAAIAEMLPKAKFGVAVWSAHLIAPEIEMLMGLVRDLNETTRFSTLTVAAPDNGNGVALTCGWMTGFPLRIGFGRGYPEFDPWAFDACRLVESGEADAAVWLSSYRPVVPNWRAIVPMIAIVARGSKFKKPPRVLFEVGMPGTNHDAVAYCSEIGALAAVTAARPSDAPSATGILDRIAGALA